MRWGCEKTHPEAPPLFSSRGKEERAPCMVWGMSMGFRYPAAHNQDLCVCRESSGDVTKELPSIAMVEGWPQSRTKDHIQPQLPPSGDEFRAVSLGGKAERMADRSVGQQWQNNADTEEKEGESLPGYSNNKKL